MIGNRQPAREALAAVREWAPPRGIRLDARPLGWARVEVYLTDDRRSFGPIVLSGFTHPLRIARTLDRWAMEFAVGSQAEWN